MPWPSWPSNPPKDPNDDKQQRQDPAHPNVQQSSRWNNNLNSTDWSHYTSTRTISIIAITSLTTLALSRLYKTYLRRIPTVEYLKPGVLRQRNLYGYVTRVGDGDNFHLFHTPGGKLAGWGWLPGRRIQDLKGKELKDRTIHVRIAGVDAPEMAHFGRPAQPHAQEAIDWLKSFVLHRYVRAYPYRKDQYDRVVCSVIRRRWVFFKADVGLNMLRRGLATVYEAKYGSEFGDREQEYRDAEVTAKRKKVGMWQDASLAQRILGRSTPVETPRQYKERMVKQEKVAKSADLAK